MIDLRGKVIVVTGGNGLLGMDLIKTIRNCHGVAVNIDSSVKSNIENDEYYCDITNYKNLEFLIDKIFHKYGKIDGWVNNAYPRTTDWNADFEQIMVESWSKNLDFQLTTVFKCCQIVGIKMREQGFGSIVNIGSIYGIVGPNFDIYKGTNMTMPAAYSAIKGGIINMTKYLASYYGKHNIRVNCVSPGGILNGQSSEFVKKYEERTPLKRIGNSSDISPSIVFLLSDAASYITGHNLVVDGGWTII